METTGEQERAGESSTEHPHEYLNMLGCPEYAEREGAENKDCREKDSMELLHFYAAMGLTQQYTGQQMLLARVAVLHVAASVVKATSLVGPLGGLLGTSWGHLGASWGALGASWGLLGASWKPLGASWKPLGDSGAFLFS